MKQYHFGVCEFSFPCRGPIAIELAGKAGFEGMQLADCEGMNDNYPFLNPFIQNAYLKAGEENHIVFQAMHLQSLFNSKYILEAPESDKGQKALACIRNGILACSQMGIPVVMITITNIIYDEQYDNVRYYIQYASDQCAKYNIQLTTETDLLPEKWLTLKDQTGGVLKLCFDTMNPTVYNTGVPAEMISEYGIENIDHFHMKDCIPNARGYFTKYTTPFRLNGEGKSGFYDCTKVIKASDYCGWFISESFYMDPVYKGEDYITLAKRDLANIKGAMLEE